MNATRAFGVATFALTAIVAGCASPPAAQAEPLNILLISVDTLRADHLGCYGYERDTSPVIDALAEEPAISRAALDAWQAIMWPAIEYLKKAAKPVKIPARKKAAKG